MKMFKIKTAAAFVDDNNTFIEADSIVVVTEEFFNAQNALLEAFDMPPHQKIEEVTVEDAPEDKPEAAPKGKGKGAKDKSDTDQSSEV